MITSYHRMRRAAGAVLFLSLIGLPFLHVREESALRFDIPTLQLLFFGSRTGIADSFVILIALLFITFLILFATTLFGRLWCGWLCPQTVLCDGTNFVESARHRGVTARTGAYLAGLLVSAVISFSLIGYFVDPREIPRAVSAGGQAATVISWSWAAMTALIFLDLVLLRRKFCATVCPYAKMQGVLFDDRTLLVAFDGSRSEECMDCAACVRACPVGIDIRHGIQSACIHCAECVDACEQRMSRRGKPSIIRYFRGLPSERKEGIRVNVVLTALMTVASFVLLAWVLAARQPFDVTARLVSTGGPIAQADGALANVYELSFRNLTEQEQQIDLRIVKPGVQPAIAPDRIVLRSGPDIQRTAVAVTIRGRSDAEDLHLDLELRSNVQKKPLSRTLTFLMRRN